MVAVPLALSTAGAISAAARCFCRIRSMRPSAMVGSGLPAAALPALAASLLTPSAAALAHDLDPCGDAAADVSSSRSALCGDAAVIAAWASVAIAAMARGW